MKKILFIFAMLVLGINVTFGQNKEVLDEAETMPSFGSYTYQKFIRDPQDPQKGTYETVTETGTKALMAFLSRNIIYPVNLRPADRHRRSGGCPATAFPIAPVGGADRNRCPVSDRVR